MRSYTILKRKYQLLKIIKKILTSLVSILFLCVGELIYKNIIYLQTEHLQFLTIFFILIVVCLVFYYF